ncbi:MAG TPA: 2-hydroxyacyl-CoA dehydratase family protein [Candidatus Deferrimicrobium sp.]|nr:2-hydroxyacyl-CoA dehydratase family protein [Candidatus Deferrimicrobium sp.]
MERFREIFKNRHQRLVEWKEYTGSFIFGYLCTYVPEEILYAAGMLPIKIIPEIDPITKGEGYLAPFLCPYIRSVFDHALKGKYAYLDGIIQNHTCDGMTHLYAEWNLHVKTPYSYFLGQPYLDDSAAKEFYLKTLTTFIQWLEVLMVRPITTAAFQDAIQVYNEHRHLLKELGTLRQNQTPHLLGSEFFEIIRAGMVSPKKEINLLIHEFLKEVRNRKLKTNLKIKVLVSGGMIEDLRVLQLIEQSGAQIVADDLCIGSRYYWNLISSDQNPIKAIGDRYIDRVSCPCRDIDRKKRLDHIIDMYKSSQAEGIIFIFQKSCGPHYGDYPYITEYLSANGIPHLLLMLEHESTAIEQMKNRVDAFIEMVEGK